MIQKLTKVTLIYFMSILISNVTAVAAATVKTAGEITSETMVSTVDFVNDLSRTEVESQIQEMVNKEEVEKALSSRGLSKEEVLQRVASLNDDELRQLSHQMEQARYGGDILFTILIVVLIIFLIKKM